MLVSLVVVLSAATEDAAPVEKNISTTIIDKIQDTDSILNLDDIEADIQKEIKRSINNVDIKGKVAKQVNKKFDQDDLDAALEEELAKLINDEVDRAVNKEVRKEIKTDKENLKKTESEIGKN